MGHVPTKERRALYPSIRKSSFRKHLAWHPKLRTPKHPTTRAGTSSNIAMSIRMEKALLASQDCSADEEASSQKPTVNRKQNRETATNRIHPILCL